MINMHEILFKAKSKETGKWVKGYYCMEHNNACFEEERIEKHYIRFQRNIDWGITQQLLEEIDVNTLSQYTGITDKNGVKIFENDIVKATYEENNGYIKWNSNNASFQVKGIPSHTLKRADYLEVIGNIFDKEVIK